jgi:hypothetical protein
MSRPGLRFVPLLGALFVVLVVVGFLVAGDTPDIDSAAPAIRGDYDNEGKHQVSAFLVALSAISLLFFGGYWRAVLRDLHPSGRTTANVALVGAGVAAAGLGVSSLIHAALAEAAQKSQVADPTLQALNALDNWSFYPFAVGLTAFVLASGVALVRGRRFFPPWLGWAGVVLGVLQLIPFTGFFAALATAVWILVISLMLFARWEAVESLRGAAVGAPSRPLP